MTEADDDTFDVLVVGGGISGGMPAAAYLQKAGCRVAVIERDASGAPFSSSYEAAPGVRFDVTPVNFSIVSPAIADLELGRFGYRVRPPEVLFSTLDGTGRHVTLYTDAARTFRELARYSAKDAQRFQALLYGLKGAAREILSTAFFSAAPDLAGATRLTATAAGLEPERLTQMSAIDLVTAMFESDAARLALTALPAINLFGDLALPGQGALAWLWTFLMRTCSVPADGVTLAQAVERAFLHHGGTVLKGATVRRFLRAADGSCRGVEVDMRGEHITLRARRAVISDLGAGLTGELLGEPLRPGWRSAGRAVFTADAVLDRPLRWAQ
ncbi:MAG TPA: FAD-dependent oxidoreductase, partial [Nevskiaceae bacterium]